ncbi:MAG: hypothetical protein WCP96_03425 [Methylococcaceae bacterium]
MNNFFKIISGQKLKKSLILFSVGILFQHNATASSYIYELNHGYYGNSDPTIFGTSFTADITFNNGGSSNLNQTFNWSDVTQIKVITNNGIFGGIFNAPAYPAGRINSFLTTDNNGTGSFVFNNSVNEYLSGTLASVGLLTNLNFQLGTGVFTNISLNTNDYACRFQFADYIPPYNSPSSWSTKATYIGVATIPVPTSILLFGSALIGWLSINKRHQQAL